MEQKAWVDFRAVKAAVTMEAVLAHYGVTNLKRRGEELRGRCPIHKGEGVDAFHVNVVKNCFQCFVTKCKKRGNVLDFVAAMEECTVRDAALKLQEWFSVPETVNGSGERSDKGERLTSPVERSGGEPMVNQPLTFTLKGIDPAHEYLTGRGIDQPTAELFGIGFFSGRGSMSGRIVIPIHNERGELVAYAGRAIDDSEPRYKLPVGFQKSDVLYNLHRVSGGERKHPVVVVEGFFDCVRVSTAGFRCVALMGSSMSVEQENLIAENFRAVWLLLDGDDSGRVCADASAGRLVRRMFTRVISLPQGKQPDQLLTDELKDLIG